jgi:NADPH:quinone reductase-like Zn-dependent oxidoreductase
MSGNEIFKPHNVAAWALKEKQRPLVVDSAPYTSPPKGNVVVKVKDVAINPIDWLVQSEATFPINYPNIFGEDVSGEIVEVGEGVDEFKIGQRVIAYISCVHIYCASEID